MEAQACVNFGNEQGTGQCGGDGECGNRGLEVDELLFGRYEDFEQSTFHQPVVNHVAPGVAWEIESQDATEYYGSPQPRVAPTESCQGPKGLLKEECETKAGSDLAFAQSQCKLETGTECATTIPPASHIVVPVTCTEQTLSNVKKKNTRKETKGNVEASRRFREKRKRERLELQSRNEEMEAERHLYLSRIADLQNEVQMLRGGGEIDLQKENQLLRAEIQKQKMFVQDLCEHIPRNHTTPEEQLRTIKGGVDSSLGQALGLAYMSFAGEGVDTWKDAKPVFVVGFGYIPIRYQYLPLGCTVKDAKRVNLRYDFVGMDAPAAVIRERGYNMFCGVHRSSEYFQITDKLKNLETKRDFEDLLPDAVKKLQADICENIQLKRYRETASDREQEVDLFLSLSTHECEIFPNAFPNHADATVSADGKFNPRKSHVLVSSQLSSRQLADAKIEAPPVTDGCQRKESKMLTSMAITPNLSNANKTDAFVVGTYPVGDTFVREFGDPENPGLNEDGELRDDMQQMLLVFYHSLTKDDVAWKEKVADMMEQFSNGIDLNK